MIHLGIWLPHGRPRVASVDDLLQRQAQLSVLEVLSRSPQFGGRIVVKGAMQVEAVTGRSRSTRDLDLAFVVKPYTFDDTGRRDLKLHLDLALRRPIRKSPPAGEWSLVDIRVEKRPRGPQPGRHGHDGFAGHVTLHRRGREQVTVKIDFSWDDFVGPAVHYEVVGDALTPAPPAHRSPILGYSAEEAVAEKLRAFLQKLPPHLRKIGRPELDERPRVRDICDVANLLRACSELEWPRVADLFGQKCRIRQVDCDGPQAFEAATGGVAGLMVAYRTERLDEVLPFEEAWAGFCLAVARVEEQGVMPVL